MHKHCICLLILMLISACLFPHYASASPIDDVTAMRSARAWLKINPAPMMPYPGGSALSIKGIRPFRDRSGSAIAYIVDLLPQGYIIVPEDDAIEPILAFSTEGNFAGDLDTKNVLSQILLTDIPDRLRRAGSLSSEYRDRVSRKWNRYRSSDALGNVSLSQSDIPLTTPSPVVGPFLNETWSQLGGPPYTYNLYTPNNYPAGCIATAMGMIIHWNAFPETAKCTNTIWVDGSARFASFNNTYDYTQMPNYLNGSSTTTQIQQVAKLLYHCGISVKMQYTASNSQAYITDVANALKVTFGYASADYVPGTQSNWASVLEADLNTLHPVQFGITGVDGSGNSIGHSVVCDGWGTDGSSHIYHLNMGWGGNSNAWYSVPSFTTSPYIWNTLVGYVYNIRSFRCQPASAAICQGMTATFTATTASWAPAATYQWYNASGAISGATGLTYTTGVAGSYYCVATNAQHKSTTNTSTLTVTTPPVVTAGNDGPVCTGGVVHLTATNAGAGATYSWTGPNGFTSASQNPTVTAASDSAGVYTVVATLNGCSSLPSTTTVTIVAATTITQSPSPVTLCSTNLTPAVFSIQATGAGTLSYQWRKDTVNLTSGGRIAGVNGATLTINPPELADQGNYDCVVTGACGSVTSIPAPLTIGPCDVSGVKAQPDGRNVRLESKQVTAAFGDIFYLQEPDRSSGIQCVKSANGITAGHLASVIGVIGTNSDGERYIDVTQLTPGSAVTIRPPIALRNNNVTGADLSYNASTGAGQQGVIVGAKRPGGPNNIGKLITAWGKVTNSGTGQFYINDGSEMKDGSGYTGIRVLSYGLPIPANGGFALVTGISSIYKLNGNNCRLIRATSITQLN